MKKLIALSLCAIALTAVKVHAQTDQENIQFAWNAVNTAHNCDDALRFLNLISADGKTKPEYYLGMGNANDCKANSEQAIYYYNKYLELRPANDSVKKRVAELTDQRNQQARVANEQRIARESYKQGTHASHYRNNHKKKRNDRPNLDDDYMGFGIDYQLALGGADAPYKKGFSLNSTRGYLLADDKVILECSANTTFLVSPNNDWYNRAFGISGGTISNSVDFGFSGGIELSPMYVIANTHSVTWAAGPMVGGMYLLMSSPQNENYEFVSGGYTLALCYGVKTNLFLGQNVMFYLEYARTTANSVTTDITGGYSAPLTTPVNHDMLKIGINYKTDSWGWW